MAYKLLYLPLSKYIVQIKDNYKDKRGTYWFHDDSQVLDFEEPAIIRRTFRQKTKEIKEAILHDVALSLWELEDRHSKSTSPPDSTQFEWIKV